MAVITQSEARQYLPGISADSVIVAALINRADAVLSAWCGYRGTTATIDPTFDRATYTRYLRGPGGRDLHLPYWPIASVTSIEDDTSEAFDGSSYLVDSGDYDVERAGEVGIVRLKQSSSHGTWTYSTPDSNVRPIKAVWVAGYTAGSAPIAIKQAVIEYVAVLWGARTTLVTGQGGLTIGDGGNVTGPNPEIPEHVKTKLRPYMLAGAYEVTP